MSLANLKVFNSFVYQTFLELIAQQIDLFNAASQGAIILKSAANLGDYADSTLYQRIPGLVRRRDAYGAGAVTAKDIAMLLATTVKIAAGTPPVNINPAWWAWIQRSPEEAGATLGKQLGEDTLADMLNTALKASVAAVSNVGATVVNDGTAGKASFLALNSTSALFGDRAQNIACWIMHSKVWHDMVATALTNTSILFTFGNVKVMQDGMGRPFIISDAPDLFDGTATYRTLGLVNAAMTVEQNGDYTENISTLNGNENIARTFQAEWSYNLGLKGYSWDKTNGGHSPTNAAIGTGTNWDQYATSIKDTLGVMLKSQ